MLDILWLIRDSKASFTQRSGMKRYAHRNSTSVGRLDTSVRVSGGGLRCRACHCNMGVDFGACRSAENSRYLGADPAWTGFNRVDRTRVRTMRRIHPATHIAGCGAFGDRGSDLFLDLFFLRTSRTSAFEHSVDIEHCLGGFCGANAQTHSDGQMTNSVPDLRAERGWTQSDLAKQLRVSRQTVNAIETGRYDPSLPLAFAIAKLFQRRIEEIFQP
jgi:putative transcriptional regulator